MIRSLVSWNRLVPWITAKKTHPTIFHLTHSKAGSQWINRVLRGLVPERVVMPDHESSQFLQAPVKAGKVYPALYLTREQFESVKRPKNSRHFVVIRDLRDTLVSLYFSLRYNSHEMFTPTRAARQQLLSEMTVEAGLIEVLQSLLVTSAHIQWSWVNAREPIVKYEELLDNDEEILADILLRKCRLKVDLIHFRDTILANRFEAFTGRSPGEENVHSHERKGVSGDWRTHFTPAVIDEFKKRYGSLLIATGYEKNFKW